MPLRPWLKPNDGLGWCGQMMMIFPETLAYLMTNPQADRSSFGIVTNGDEILFVKLRSGDRSTYAVSRVFSPIVRVLLAIVLSWGWTALLVLGLMHVGGIFIIHWLWLLAVDLALFISLLVIGSMKNQ